MEADPLMRRFQIGPVRSHTIVSRALLITALAAGAILATPPAASADPFRLFESGTPGSDGQTHGYRVDDGSFTGLRFNVRAAVKTTAIGAHFGVLGGTDIFGAIVALSGPSDLPDSQALSTPDLLGGTRITLSPSGVPVPSHIVSAPLELALAPGWYALVFGSGLFGATGAGLFTLDNFPRGDQKILGSGGITRPELPFQEGSLTQNRLYAFVDADAAPVPEPATLLLVGIGVALVALARRKDAQARRKRSSSSTRA